MLNLGRYLCQLQCIAMNQKNQSCISEENLGWAYLHFARGFLRWWSAFYRSLSARYTLCMHPAKKRSKIRDAIYFKKMGKCGNFSNLRYPPSQIWEFLHDFTVFPLCIWIRPRSKNKVVGLERPSLPPCLWKIPLFVLYNCDESCKE